LKHPEDVVVGRHRAGAFTIIVSRCVFEKCTEEDAKYFEVLVHEKKVGHPWIFYVNIVQDARFAWFSWMQTFERKANDEDVVEFNAHVSDVFHQIGHPTFKLSRRSIVRLFEHCATMYLAYMTRIPDNPPERTYTCPGCKKAVKATRVGESCTYVVEHVKEEKPKKSGDEEEGKCKYKGPVEVK
jgi:hypothetical protein